MVYLIKRNRCLECGNIMHRKVLLCVFPKKLIYECTKCKSRKSIEEVEKEKSLYISTPK